MNYTPEGLPLHNGQVPIRLRGEPGHEMSVSTTGGSARSFIANEVYLVRPGMYHAAVASHGAPRVEIIHDYDPAEHGSKGAAPKPTRRRKRVVAAAEPEPEPEPPAADPADDPEDPPEELTEDEQAEQLQAAMVRIIKLDDPQLLDGRQNPSRAALQQQGITFDYDRRQFGAALKAARAEIAAEQG